MEKLLKKIGSHDQLAEDNKEPTALVTDNASNKKRKKRQLSNSSVPEIATIISPSLSEAAVSVNTPTSAPSPSAARDPKKSKITRYHGSSSGYYLVGNILDSSNNSANNNNSSQQQTQQQEQHAAQDINEKNNISGKVYVLPSFNSGQDIRLRRVNADDDDLVVVRDTTADEEACQQAADDQETIDSVIPRSLLTCLVHT